MVLRFAEVGVLELLLVIGSNSMEAGVAEWNVIVLEMLYNILRHVQPREVFILSEQQRQVCSFKHFMLDIPVFIRSLGPQRWKFKWEIKPSAGQGKDKSTPAAQRFTQSAQQIWRHICRP